LGIFGGNCEQIARNAPPAILAPKDPATPQRVEFGAQTAATTRGFKRFLAITAF